MARALITGITGQDGSYLTEFLLAKGYEIHGLVRRPSRLETSHLAALYGDLAIYNRRLFLHEGELEDPASLRRTLAESRPEEIYHLASPSHVGTSFERPAETCQAIGIATVRLLELARELQPLPKFFHASTGHIFGDGGASPQDEQSPASPVSPYGCAKLFATQMVTLYRKTHGLFACNGILFNHESPRRGLEFVTRKICRGAAAIRLGLQKELVLGDLGAQRDWGDARDYVRGMWLILQHAVADDFVLATGQLHSVQDVVEQAFGKVGVPWKQYVRFDARFSRLAEPRRLVGNAAKAKRLLGWEPRIPFEEMIAEMTQAELAALSADALRERRPETSLSQNS